MSIDHVIQRRMIHFATVEDCGSFSLVKLWSSTSLSFESEWRASRQKNGICEIHSCGRRKIFSHRNVFTDRNQHCSLVWMYLPSIMAREIVYSQSFLSFQKDHIENKLKEKELKNSCFNWSVLNWKPIQMKDILEYTFHLPSLCLSLKEACR